MPGKGLLITGSNIHQLTSNDILSFSSKEYWHKFILKNGGLFDKEAILLAILESVAPFDLVPVKYTVTGSNAYFLARNCGQAIEKFCLNLLLPIKLKEPHGEQIVMSIETCSIPIEQYKMNMQYHLKKAIEKRYDGSLKSVIDLSCFHKEPELFEVLFCPLSKPRFLTYVLSIIKRIWSVKAINLSNNNIESLESLEILQKFEGLVSLDLSNNMIKDPSLTDLLGKTLPELQEIYITGNPVCSLFKTDAEYLKWIQDKISSKTLGITDAFLRHYFTLYDDNRQGLKHTYDKNAIFSLTCDCHHHAKDSKDSKFDCYKYESRNLLKVNNENKIVGIFHQKNTDIAKVLWKLPLTEHDPFSFKIDVLFYEEPFIVLIVSGVFKDFQDTPRIRSFSRTFALKRVAKDEFKVTNDLYYVRNATNDEISDSFLYPKSKIDTPEYESLITKFKEHLIEVVARLTEMNSAYSKMCLEECRWDMKKALEVFLKHYQNFNIPPEAFY